MKKIVFTGGGTVGHVTLNLLLIPSSSKTAGKSTISGINTESNTKEILQSGLNVTFHSIATGKFASLFLLAKYAGRV